MIERERAMRRRISSLFVAVIMAMTVPGYRKNGICGRGERFLWGEFDMGFDFGWDISYFRDWGDDRLSLVQ